MNVIISYDIVSNKTRRKVMRFLLNYGKRIQKSVYFCAITLNDLKVIKSEIKKMIKTGEDRVRYWEVCNKCYETLEIHGITIDLSFNDEFIII